MANPITSVEEIVPLSTLNNNRSSTANHHDNISTTDEGTDKNSLSQVCQGLFGRGWPSRHRTKTLGLYLLTKVLMPSLDVGTDVWTAFDWRTMGHHDWFLVTLSLMFCPFAAKVVSYLYKKARHRHDAHLKKVILALPVVQPAA